ncbi:hypothetical protein [Allosalinactinospora lopnorensis]|uniref:hypothetical protein n=1 Tax=Allosalinactinospora lopnorensis TaxID=1352348 RepID=UPI000623FF39|nr:hypothetical protein [Allosalinactinospora lopnorensis]
MLRSGRAGRVSRVASAVCAVGGSTLRRLLLIGGFVAAAWVLGSASASAEEIGGADVPAAGEAVAESAADSEAAETADVAGGDDTASAADAAEQTEQQVESVGRSAAETVEHTAPVGRSDSGDSSAAEAAEQVPSRIGDAETEGPRPELPSAGNADGRKAADVSEVVDRVGDTGTKIAQQVTGSVGGDRAGSDRETVGRADVAEEAGPRPGGPLTAEQRFEVRPAAQEESADVPAWEVGGTHGAQESEADAHSEGPAQEDGTPTNLLLKSAVQSHSCAAMAVYAGDLPSTSIVLPIPGLHNAARHALAIVPQNPVDEPTFSPD